MTSVQKKSTKKSTRVYLLLERDSTISNRCMGEGQCRSEADFNQTKKTNNGFYKHKSFNQLKDAEHAI